jgi:murein DD-endopeptidase MepM/ murein hydrolase activator NlpD
MVEVDHGQGFSTRYAHLSEILVSVGDKLSAGDSVGRTGSSGRSTGPHLHYEVRHNGEAVNPLTFLTVGKKIAQYM